MSLQIIQTLQAQFEKNVQNLSTLTPTPLPQAGEGRKQPTLWVAYSGGLDSHVLLHALNHLQKNYNFKLHAIHIHHGIHQNADEWATHSLRVGKSLAQHCEIIKVNAERQSKQSLEETARNARYEAFQSLLNHDDYLMTAHHADDQAETFLLQLLRGAGTKGLSAMPTLSRLGKGFLWRPFLAITRDELHQYALLHQLSWIEDDSNTQLNFDRNYLRHQVIPSLKNRWPHFANNVAHSAKHCAETEALLERLTHQDYLNTAENIARGRGSFVQDLKWIPAFAGMTNAARMTNAAGMINVVMTQNAVEMAKLNISKLRTLSLTRRQNVLRYWLQQRNLPLPNRAQLQQFEKSFLLAKDDANPILRWSTIQLRRYQNYIYVLPYDYKESIDTALKWDLLDALELPYNIGQLITKNILEKGIRQDCLKNSFLEIRFRQGGETIYLPQHANSKTLKNLFYELHIPPWERGRIPLIYMDGELAQLVLGSHCLTAKKFAAQENEMGLEIRKEFPCSLL